MKKFTIVLSLMCFITLQSSIAQDIKFGVKGGLTYGTLTTDDNEWQGFKPGYEVGLFGQYQIMDMLGVSLEPVFAQNGVTDFDPLLIYSQTSPKLMDENGDAIEYADQKLTFSVISVPVLAQYNLDMGMNLRLFAGPSFDFITKAEHYTLEVVSGIGEDFTQDIETYADVTERFEYVNYCAVIGVGFDMEIDDIDLRIDVKYQHGFSNINTVQNKPGLYTRTFGVSVAAGLNRLILE